jgi:hypothetical protein
MQLERKLYEEGIIEKGVSALGFGQQARVSHSSPLIRAVVSKHRGLTVEPIDVFVVTYLAARSEADHVILESNQRRFLEERLRAEESTLEQDWDE